MPFRHVAMFRWAEHVDGDHVERVRVALDELTERVPGLRRHTHGSDVGVSEGTFDYLVVADFDDVAAWRAYRDHPAHLLLVEELIVDHVDERCAGQFLVTDGLDPTVQPIATADTGLDGDETDDELMERARRAAMAEMQALLAEPDDAPGGLSVD